MSINNMNPYLNFNGTAEQAIRLYERALGATRETLMRFGDVPGMTQPPEHTHRIIHARLRLGDGVVMISDGPPNVPVPTESNVHVCLHFDDIADMKRRFEALGAGGTVTMPLQETFWAAQFGMLTDAFGVRWMFNCEKKG